MVFGGNESCGGGSEESKYVGGSKEGEDGIGSPECERWLAKDGRYQGR